MYLEIIDGVVYACDSSPLWDRPALITSCWKTNVDPSLVRNGQAVKRETSGYSTRFGEVTVRVDLIETYPSITQEQSIRPPRGKRKVTWRNGEWK